MRKPPDKDRNAVLTERDVVSSNATLNTVFGRARRKSWMTSPQTQVCPTPRANIPKAGMPQPALAQESVAGILPSPAPSDEPSPILSNTLFEESHTLNNTCPQPRLGENQQQRPASILHTQIFGEDARCSASEADPQLSSIFIPAPTQNSTRQAAQPSISRNPAIAAASSNAPASINTEAAANFAGLHSATIPVRQINHPDSRQLHDSPQRFAAGTAQIQASGLATGSVPRGERAGHQLYSPDLTTTFSSPSPGLASNLLVPSGMGQQAQAHHNSPRLPARPVNPVNPHKRQRTQEPVMGSLRARVPQIQQQIKSISGKYNLNMCLEGPRFNLLINACNGEDIFYVVLHQMFCLWDLPNPTLVKNIPGFPDYSTLLRSFKVLGQLIRDNGGLLPDQKKWFSQFPAPLPDLLKHSEPYRRAARDVSIFLCKLDTEWAPLSGECSGRKYPPLVDELVSRLGLLSPVLQQVAFTAARRNLGVGDDIFGQQMEALFTKDRQAYQALSARRNTTRPPTQMEMIERNAALTQDYLFISNQYLQARQRSTAPNPLTRVATAALANHHPQFNSIVLNSSPGAQTGNQDARRPNDPSATQQWQPSTQHPQQTWIGSTSSPSLPTAAYGRNPTLPSHPYQNIPSPIPVQNLSMQSPPQQAFSPILSSNDNQAPAWINQNLPTNAEGHAQQGQNQYNEQRIQQAYTPHQLNSQRLQNLALQQTQQLQWQQLQQQLSSHPPGQQAQRQYSQNNQAQAQPQQQQELQQQAILRQHLSQHAQHLLNSNRNPQYRRDSALAADLEQRVHSTNGSVSSASRHTPGAAPQTPVLQQIPQGQQRKIQIPSRPLLPPLGILPPQGPTNSEMTALHQSRLRSPLLVLPKTSCTESPQNDSAHRYYQVVKGLALGPTKLNKAKHVTKLEFSISGADLALIPQDRLNGHGKLAIRQLKRGTLQYRLRCIASKPESTVCLLPAWVISDTSWPDNIFLSINQHDLEIRRKYHCGKDMPVDITRDMASSGLNTTYNITISIIKWLPQAPCYFFGVEIIEIMEHKQIMDMCQQQRIPSSQTLEAIKKSLVPIDDVDNGFAMVMGDLTLDLTDPFTARIFEIPVRGRTCRHRECFDLETFLLTRNSKAKRPQQPCAADAWKCPLCGSDARPYNLQVDEFLVSVRAELIDKNMSDVKFILISPDGTWKAKPEQGSKRKAPDNDSDDESSDGEKILIKGRAVALAKNPVDVIELE